MIIYKRDIVKKLWSLRLSFLLLVAIFFMAFILHYDAIGYVIGMGFIIGGSIVVRDFIVCSDSFQISKIYLFGLVKRTWHYNKGENIKVSSSDLEFGQDAEPNFEDGGSGLGCLFLFFSFFVPSKVVRRDFKVEKFSASNEILNKTRMVLDKKEFNHLETFILRSQST